MYRLKQIGLFVCFHNLQMTNQSKQFNIAFITGKTLQANYAEKFKKEFEHFNSCENIAEYRKSKHNISEVLLIEETGNES